MRNFDIEHSLKYSVNNRRRAASGISLTGRYKYIDSTMYIEVNLYFEATQYKKHTFFYFYKTVKEEEKNELLWVSEHNMCYVRTPVESPIYSCN